MHHGQASWTRLGVAALSSLLAAACSPTDPFEGIDSGGPPRCKRNLDCSEGEICNPGSLRCVQDVSVGAGEFAGTAWFVVGEGDSGVRAGQTKNVYVKANFLDREIVFDDLFAQEVVGRWFVNLTQATGDGRFSMAFIVDEPPDGPGEIPLHDEVDPDKPGTSGVLGALGEDYFTREFLGVTQAGAITLQDYPAPIEPLEQVRISFAGKLEDIGPAAYLTFSTPCGTNDAGMAVGLYEGVDDQCLYEFGLLNLSAGLDCFYAEERPGDGGRSNFAWNRPAGQGRWLANSDSAVGREGKCQAGRHESGEILAVAYAGSDPDNPNRYIDLEIRVPQERLSEGAVIPLNEVSARLWELTITPNGVESVSLGRLGSGSLRVHRFVATGERPRLYLSIKGSLGGHLTEGQDCDQANDECMGGLACQPAFTGTGSWCMEPCSAQRTCGGGRSCGNYDVGGTEYTICADLYAEYQSGCDPDPRRHQVCTGDLSCADYEGSRVCLTPCTAGRCPTGKVCGASGYCLEQVATYAVCGGEFQGCEGLDQCVQINAQSGGSSTRCLQMCQQFACPTGESCWPSNDPQISHCFRDLAPFADCRDARFLEGSRCRPGTTCVRDIAGGICMQECGSQTCAAGTVCVNGMVCFRELARFAACDQSVFDQGYACAARDICVRRTDRPAQPSFCYARCGAGQPACTGGTTCQELTNGLSACLTP